MAIELISLVQVPGLRPQPDGSRIPGLVWKAEIRSPGGHSILKFYQDSEPTDSEIRTKMEPPHLGPAHHR